MKVKVKGTDGKEHTITVCDHRFLQGLCAFCDAYEVQDES